MRIKSFQTGDTYDASLTTDHAASSYGQPVLLVDGAALGPADVAIGYAVIEASGVEADWLWPARAPHVK